MNEQTFGRLCKRIIAEQVNEDTNRQDDPQITEEEVYIVWMCKTLQNNKALLSTTLPDDMYYECTYNGDKRELYVDAYHSYCGHDKKTHRKQNTEHLP